MSRKNDLEGRQANLLKLVQVLSFLVVFAAGVILGLLTSTHMNAHFTSRYAAPLFSYNYVSAAPPSQADDLCAEIVETVRAETEKKCVKVDCISMETFLHPQNLSHRMTDDEIMWRASMVPRKAEFPFKRVPKVAFMFLTRGPLPMLPLWEMFFEGQDKNLYSIYIHSHGYDLKVSKESAFYGRHIPSQIVQWGSVKLVDAERRLLANALLDQLNERFVLLSESCIPVYNFPIIYEYLTSSAHSFVESYDDPTRYGRGRYSRSMLPYISLHQWRKGSQWFEIKRELATHIIADTLYYDLFRRYCKPACYPDEHYIPTYLHMFHGSQNANRTVTWVDWSLGGPHPATFRKDDINEDFIRAIRDNGTSCSYNSENITICNLFARKFAASTLEPLLNLTTTVLEF
ncbi:hypothetical protein MLD38_025595 [Melastoma candidum]|uniref:Uncharacterized protein n=1 Tax=Melastoma candidum TaxID=119954 RepID=A0ACB9NYZ0_9MYRT|nr:hypothetical protein MLD38_025595 [Melastoma candidum]